VDDVPTSLADASGSPAALAEALASTGYLADTGLATVGFLGVRLERPIFLEGEAGAGKTAFAAALAQVRGVELIRLQCYEGLDVSQALYDWDFARQILHLRTAEAAHAADPGQGLYDRRFLLARPLLRALESAPCVLLVDEIDRADDEFEAYLLELLGEWAVTIPEIGRVVARTPPTVVLTSNRTRDVHDALKRRCLYHWVAHPDPQREAAILRLRLPAVHARLTEQVARATAALRTLDLVKPPGIAEAIDWTRALDALGADEVTVPLAEVTLGAALKVREDIDRVRGRLPALVSEGFDG